MIALLKNWRSALTVAFGLALIASIVVGHVRLDAEQATTQHVAAALTRAEAAFDRTVASYRFTAEQAARRDAENIVRVRAEQAVITQGVVNDYEVRLRDSADRYERLRAQAAGYSSRLTTAAVPDTSDATCRAYTGTGCDELPALLKAAQDNTDQLVALIAWTKAQATVSPSQGQP